MPATLHEVMLDEVRAVLAQVEPGKNEQAAMHTLLRICARWRSEMVANTILTREGGAVIGGPFAGMAYLPQAAEGARAARLLGTYEDEIAPHLIRLAARASVIADIGCAEGYYAVGLARRFPHLSVRAHDTSPEARRLCETLAAANDVGGRVKVGGEFHGEEFATLPADTLIFMDIEGGEVALLDPERWPALRGLPIIVETHPDHSPQATELIAARFAVTHHVTMVHQAMKAPALPEWFAQLSQLDALMAVWEWRFRPTPWLVMEPRA